MVLVLERGVLDVIELPVVLELVELVVLVVALLMLLSDLDVEVVDMERKLTCRQLWDQSGSRTYKS
eukprot:6491363-Amphidinium_carterae.1